MGRQRLHSEGFRRIVPAVEHVEPKFLRLAMRPMRTFTRDEGIDAFSRRSFQMTAGSAGYDANLATDSPAAGYQRHARLHAFHKPLHELIAIQGGSGL